jgi:O-methyltransferase domain/Dimerisation domain
LGKGGQRIFMDRGEWNPGKLLGLSGSYWNACTLHAGVKLDIFTILGSQSLNARAIAKKVKGNIRGVTMLLNALAAMHLLTKQGDRYTNATAAQTFLSKDSPDYLGFMILHHHHLMPSWSRLDKGVLTGKPIRTRASFGDGEVREAFLMGMFNMAMNLAPRIAASLDLSNRSHLLDLGGGPGTYAIHFCLKNPNLKATVYDLPTTRPFAEKTIHQFGLSRRIGFQEGNYLTEAISGRFDIVWLSQILHGEGLEDCQGIVQKGASVLEPGGLILVHEFLLNNEMDGPLFPAIFSLNMLVGTPRGQSYSEQDVRDMLAKAGARDIRRIPISTPNDSGIICGTL